MAIDTSQFLQTFYEESFEGLDAMETGLLNLDVGAADAEEINTIFRAAHSIKGGSATFGLNNVADFTHLMETLLDEMRDGRRNVATPEVDVLLQSVDCLREMLTAAKEGHEYDADRSEELKNQLGLILGMNTSAKSEDAAKSETDTSSVAMSVWNIKFTPHENLFKTGNDPVRMFRELAELGKLESEINIENLPGIHDIDPEACYVSWHLTLTGEISESAVREIFEWVEDECDLDISLGESAPAAVESKSRPVDPAPKAVEPVATQKPVAAMTRENKSSGSESASIRVSIDKVDDLINMVGELVITQSMLGQLGQDFDISKLEKLNDGLSQLERNTRELQESVMRIRMLPISFAFQRFPRMVRDLSQKLNKKIELRMSGEGTELDKTVMEKIGDPLVHLVRNSLDHGIESPEARKKAGKPETGIVTLNAYHQGGNIVIEIIDDGAGLNRERILKKAIERKLVAEDEQVSDEKIYELIFHPGFSTAETVSDVSGRGVGMDVVKKNIKALGGSVDVTSELGKGSKFTIRLPLTLAILDGQLVRVGSETYIVPLVSIIETLQIKEKFINSVAGKAEMYRLREDYIPIIRLYEVFGLEPDQEELENGLLVVVEGDGQKAGLFVDDLLSQQQVVIKSLETNFKKVNGISGATILGDGTVSLILDIAGVIDYSKDTTKSKSTSGRAA